MSGAADGLSPVLLSFTVLRATGSIGRLGMVLACQSTAALGVTLLGGVAGDRFSRGRVLICSLLVRMAAAVTLAAALVAHSASFGLLLAVAGAYGCADGFFSPVSTALLPDIVPRAQLAAVNALTGGSTSGAVIVAPVLAGVIVATCGPGAGFAVQAAVLAAAACFLASARLPAQSSEPAGWRDPVRQIRIGWTEFSQRRWLWMLTGQWTVFSLVLLAPVAVLGPVLAQQQLGGAWAWGVIGSSLALGAVGGQLVAGRIRPPGRPTLVIAWLVPVMTVEALALGLSGSLAIVAVAAAVTGLAMGAQGVIFQTAMQTGIEPAVLSRVAAIDLLGSEGGQPVGYALAGPAAALVGAHTVLTVGAVVMLIAALAFTFSRSLRVGIDGGSGTSTPQAGGTAGRRRRESTKSTSTIE